ncbi:unnamed protein product [Coregonus sp. 'balchen']|nr:unnamed protein product [Coregonus sp. 'balchen']
MDSCEMAPPTPPEEVDPSPRRKRGRRKMEPLEPKEPNMEARTPLSWSAACLYNNKMVIQQRQTGRQRDRQN